MIVLPGYKIEERLHIGEKTIVYRAKKGQDSVIIKHLKNEFPTQAAIKAFKKEIEILNKISLPSVVKVKAVEKFKHSLVIVFEDIHARSLNDFLKEKQKLNLEEFLQIGIKLVQALADLHALRIVHKDIKPHNIIYNSETQRLQFIDFGSASLLSKENPVLINTGALEGTLSYISPEQTGRMNRNIDYRTDFYSLGVTFYQLITGELPFDSQDSIELIHSHIAIQPVSPNEKFSSIYKTLSDIIMKLLSKPPEDRYQSCSGLLLDMEECRRQFSTTGRIDEFKIGQNDISSQFRIPEKLYGRESEIKILLNAFERVSINEKSDMILIAGPSGTGKSALIQELYKPITKTKGYFILGKYDQFKKDLPYNAFIQAFTELTRQLLTESEASTQKWKQVILNALGNNAGVMTELISELELLIGKQESPLPLGPIESQNRFTEVITNFVKVFAMKEHPLAIFLDDVQWADNASLKLIKILYTDHSIGSLFIICSYRDNEVDSLHPFTAMLEDIKKENLKFELLKLSPLRIEHVSELIMDSLFCDIKDSKELAHIVHGKTDGNPFFVTELLKTLYNEDLIEHPSIGEKSWKWDIAKIKSVKISDNVVELMSSKIEKLPAETISVMKLASCIGAKFYLDDLIIVLGKSETDILSDLTPAIDEGMILTGGSSAKFAHDRVREATYSLMNSNEKDKNHYKIGKLLLENTNEELIEDKIFNIAGQLNLGKKLIQTEEEKLKLIKLNLRSGKKAKASTAYDAALNFLKEGADLLPDSEKWEKYYALSLEIYTELVECEYLITHFEEADQLYEYIYQNTKAIFDKIPIIYIQLRQKASEFKPDQAFQIGFSILEQLGLKMPDLKNPETIQSMFMEQLEEYKRLLADRSILSLFELPEMKDRNILEAIKIISNLGDIAIALKPEMLGITSILGVTLSLTYGNTNVSAISYVMWGVITNLAFKDYKSGYDLGQLSLKLSQKKFPNESIYAKVLAFYGWNINHWIHHAKNDMDFCRDGLAITMANSDLVYSSYFTIMSCKVSHFIGENLVEVENYSEKNLIFADKYKMQFVAAIAYPTLLFSFAMQGKTENLISFKTDFYNDEDYLKKYEPIGQAIAYFYLRKLQLFYTANEYQKCFEILPNVEKYFPNIPQHIGFCEFHFFNALLLIGYGKNFPEEQKKIYEEKFKTSYEYLKLWSDLCAENFLHKFLLVEAELARIEDRKLDAIDAYNKSIEYAIANDYINDAALASELTGQFFIELEKTKIAQLHLKDAHYYYYKWGAIAKSKQLEEKYAELLKSYIQDIETPTYSTTINAASSTKTEIDTTSTSSFLDLNTVIKASQAISGEIQLGKLLEKMMRTLLESAGAERGFFILKQNGKWLIQANGDSKSGTISVLQAKDVNALGDKQELSPNIINYVIRTKSVILLNHASKKGMFVNDDYVKETQPKSILSYPIINQGNLVGVVYLENNLTTDAFTPDRVEILKILSSQIAVNVENSLLYANLEEKVEERTRDLNQALIEVRGLKEQQDGDYFLNTLLLEPLCKCNSFSKVVTIESFIKQKKKFIFRRNEYELGGDINISETIELQGKRYIVFLNGDAMGKSIQGAGGLLVLGTVFKSIIQRTASVKASQNVYPEVWLKKSFIEMHKAFESFDGSMLMSVAFGLIDEITGTMFFMNADHPSIVLLRDGVPSFIETSNHYRKLGTQGLTGNICIEVFSLRPNDKIILGSDGRDDIIIGIEPDTDEEIINQDKNLFLSHVKNADGDLNEIYEEIKKFGNLMDDLSLLKIHYKGAALDQDQLEKDLKKLQEYKENKKYTEFVYIGSRVIANYPHLTHFLFEMSYACRELGNYEKAVEFGERLRLRNAENTLNLINLIELYTKLGKKEKATSILDACLKSKPNEERFIKLKEELNNVSSI